MSSSNLRRIYALEINKNYTVADKLQLSVTSSLRRSVRGGVESSQLALLQTKIPRTCSSVADWLRISSGSLSSKVKDLLEGVLYITWWSVWMFRNQLLFSSKAPRKDVIFDDIVSRSFTILAEEGYSVVLPEKLQANGMFTGKWNVYRQQITSTSLEVEEMLGSW
ncbi:hypothetical protein Tco_1037705 [Tanacetum coccineum]